MTNDYFNASSPLTRHTLARSAQVNSIFDSVAAGLDKLPAADPLNQGRVTYVADTGAANAYVVALAKAPSAYTAGLSIVMKAANTNTGASTINVNSLGVKTIKRYNGDDTVANDIVAGALIHLVYDGTNFRIVGANGAESALAKEWATSTSVVSGGLKGARGYAQDASTSANAAAASEANAEGHFETFQGIFYGPTRPPRARRTQRAISRRSRAYFTAPCRAIRRRTRTAIHRQRATGISTPPATMHGSTTAPPGVTSVQRNSLRSCSLRPVVRRACRATMIMETRLPIPLASFRST